MRPPARALVLALVAAAFQVVVVAANVWPASRTAPRDVPVVVAGPQRSATAVALRIETASPGAFRVERLPDEEAARQALTDRRAYGAIVVGRSGPRLLIASGAGPAVAQVLTELGRRLTGQPTVTPRDVVPAARHDPRGTGGGGLVLALILSGIGGAVLLSLHVRPALWRVVGLLTFAACGGAASALVAGTALSVLLASYPALAGMIALSTLAVAASVAGLGAAIPRAGIGLGAAVMMLLANPWSGATSAPEMLPRPWGTIGQDLPAGAAATLLRSVTFFDGAGAGTPLTVLLIWTSYGLILLAAGTRRHQPPPVPLRPYPAPRHAGRTRDVPTVIVAGPAR
jgi:hypothetical protein